MEPHTRPRLPLPDFSGVREKLFSCLSHCHLGFVWPHHRAWRILVPRPGIKPTPTAVEAQSLNHWTAREFLSWGVSCCCCCCVTSVVSDSVRPHRRQPTGLPRPWDSPGKNTGVGCHFLLQCMKVKSQSEVTQSCSTLSDPMDCSLPGSSIHGIFQARILEWGAIAFSVYIFFCPF